jgi:hypothetical protein
MIETQNVTTIYAGQTDVHPKLARHVLMLYSGTVEAGLSDPADVPNFKAGTSKRELEN